MSARGSPQAIAILVGSITGAFLAYVTQSIQPLTSFLFPFLPQVSLLGNVSNLLVGNPVSGLTIYLTIPVIVGSASGLMERDNPWINGFLSGLISGIVNLAISDSDLAQVKDFLQSSTSTTVSSQLQAQFVLFAVMLTVLWGLLAGFSSKAIS